MITRGVDPHLLTPPVSVPRVLLHPRGLAPRIVNLDEWAWHIIDNVQAESVRNPSYSASTPRRGTRRPSAPAATATPATPPRVRGTTAPAHERPGQPGLRLITTLTHFGTATDVTIAELRLEAFLPADEATSAALAELVRC